jgi:CDP-glucose 4,6-dehydratase
MNILKNTPVLVTGASGLVGSWLVKELLNTGVDVSILLLDHDPHSELIRSKDIQRCKVYSGDLRDMFSVRRAVVDSQPEIIFHLGAQTIVGNALVDPISTFESNIQGTWNLLESVRTSQLKRCAIVVASSDKAYGTSEVLPYHEDTPLLGEGPYDVSKSCTDLIARSYFLTYGLNIAIARCGNIYGGGDLNWSRIVPGAISDLLKGNTTKIRSNGLFLRDYLYVKDVVAAYIQIAGSLMTGSNSGEAFNISREEPISVLDIYRTISLLVRGSYMEPVVLNEAHGEIVNQHLSSKKARELLHWESRYPLQEGLNETIEWYKNYFSFQNVS